MCTYSQLKKNTENFVQPPPPPPPQRAMTPIMSEIVSV